MDFKNNIYWVLMLACLWACRPDKENSVGLDSHAERSAFLRNLGENYIAPELEQLKMHTAALVAASDSFVNKSTSRNLLALQNAYDKAYMQYLRVDAFRFDPFVEQEYKLSMYDRIAVMPCNITLLEKKIADKVFNAKDFNFGTRSFSTLDYLLFVRSGNNDSVLTKLSEGHRMWYLSQNCNYLDSMVAVFQQGWAQVQPTFANNASTSAGSALINLFNAYIISYEFVINAKVRNPAGLTADHMGVLNLDVVEAYHSGHSKKYLKQHVQSLYDIWVGKGASPKDSIGFDDVVIAHTQDTVYVNATLKAFERSLAAIEALPDPRLEVNMVSHADKVKQVEAELALLARYIKTELASKLGLTITYSINDGD